MFEGVDCVTALFLSFHFFVHPFIFTDKHILVRLLNDLYSCLQIYFYIFIYTYMYVYKSMLLSIYKRNIYKDLYRNQI